MAPIPDIPSEVLGEIFYFTLRGPISNKYGDKSLFPWHLGLVCKTWRHAFVTYPKLWASITLDVEFHVKRDVLENFYNCFLLCLQRSGNHPLNLFLNVGSDKCYEDRRPVWTSIWKAFLSCSHRWKYVVINGLDGSEFRDLTLCNGRLPLLQRLSMWTTTTDSQDCDVFLQAPCLTQVTFFFMYKIVSHRWLVPWSQLTTFTLILDGISNNALHALLENLQGIQELRLYYRCGQSPDLSFPPTCLKHLRVLDVDSYHHIFPVISAPSLLELRLETLSEAWHVYLDQPERFNFKVVEAFVELSACHLRNLVLAGFRAAYVKPLADLFHYIEELCIDTLDGYCSLLEVLTDKQEFIAFPKLRTFTLICSAEYADKKIETITTILELRNGSYVGAPPSVSLVPLDTIVLQLKQGGPIISHSYDPIPVPPAFKDAISMWAPFEIDVQVEQ
jgi:hypothetical protein